MYNAQCPAAPQAPNLALPNIHGQEITASASSIHNLIPPPQVNQTLLGMSMKKKPYGQDTYLVSVIVNDVLMQV